MGFRSRWKLSLVHFNCLFWLFCAICVFFKEVITKGSEASRLNEETKDEQRDETDDAISGAMWRWKISTFKLDLQ